MSKLVIFQVIISKPNIVFKQFLIKKQPIMVVFFCYVKRRTLKFFSDEYSLRIAEIVSLFVLSTLSGVVTLSGACFRMLNDDLPTALIDFDSITMGLLIISSIGMRSKCGLSVISLTTFPLATAYDLRWARPPLYLQRLFDYLDACVVKYRNRVLRCFHEFQHEQSLLQVVL